MHCNQTNRFDRIAIVITHMRPGHRLPRFLWLGLRYAIDQSDWIVLAPETWQALAMGDEPLWRDLERKLLITSHQHQPERIAIVGYPDCGESPEGADDGRQEVQRIARRVRACNLPVEVLGFWSKASCEDGEPVSPTAADCEEQCAPQC